MQAANDLDPTEEDRGGGEVVRHQRGNVGGARIDVHRDERDQHQDRAEEGVEEELERRVDPPLAAPDPDDEEHRDQPRLEEEIEEHEVERAEHAEHQRLQHQERDHVFLDAGLHRPAGGDGQRHEEGREQDEEDRNAVHAHLVVQARDPVEILDELEAGVGRIEPGQQEQRHEERRPGRDQRDPLGVLPRRGIIPPQEQREDRRRDGGNEGDDGQQVLHQGVPPDIAIHVMSPPIPSTIAKA